MTYIAIVSTGVQPIPVPDVKLHISSLNLPQEDAEGLTLNFDRITVKDIEVARGFLYSYAALRDLILLEDLGPYDFALVNPRHDTIRKVTVSEDGINLLEFIEPRFLKIRQV